MSDDEHPAMPAVTAPEISRNCAVGNHRRCLGTVYVYPPNGEGRYIVDCGCPVPSCGHGAEPRNRSTEETR